MLSNWGSIIDDYVGDEDIFDLYHWKDISTSKQLGIKKLFHLIDLANLEEKKRKREKEKEKK